MSPSSASDSACVSAGPESPCSHSSGARFPLRMVRWRGFAVNPVSTLIALVLTGGLIVYCAVGGEQGANALRDSVFYGQEGGAMSIAGQLSWLYLGSVFAWLVFLLYLVVSWGTVRLGAGPPEYSDVEYFCLIFTAGVAMGIFFYGVAQGMSLQLSQYSGSRFAASPFLTQDDKDGKAMDLAMLDWGLNTFCPYALVGVMMAHQSFVRGLPMSSRSLFYDLLGDYTFGWLGDLIDGYSIVAVMSGLLASLGISVLSFMQGFRTLGWLASDLTELEDKLVQTWIVAAIVGCAAISAGTGIKRGMKLLASTAMIGSSSVWLVCFALENKPYVLNVALQLAGSYFSQLLPLSLHTDAFAQLRAGEGHAIEDPAGLAAPWYVTTFPIFQQAWSMSLAPFVGTFYARISRGRTVRECIGYTLFVSFVYYLVWFSLFSGGGIRMARRAAELRQMGSLAFGDASAFEVPGRAHCLAPPAEPVTYCLRQNSSCATYHNYEPYVAAVCEYTGSASLAYFDYLLQFQPLGTMLAYTSFVSMLLFFVTTSDSMGFVLDQLSSNGDEHHSWLQRVAWTLLQAVLTGALIWTGSGDSALRMAQAICILASLPIVVFLSVACANFVYSLDHERRAASPTFHQPVFGGVLDVGETICSLGHHVAGRGAAAPPSRETWRTFALALFAPWCLIWRAHSAGEDTARLAPNDRPSRAALAALAALTGLLWSAALALVWIPTLRPLAFVSWFWFAFLVAGVRNRCRREKSLVGNAVEDFFLSVVLYPQVIAQVYVERTLSAELLKRSH
jgi:choline-glycine betaine transporter